MNTPAYKNISDVSKQLNIPSHTLRFWETKFTYLAPKKVGGNRFYTENDIVLLQQISHHLKVQGYTIKGVLAIMREVGIENFRNAVRSTAQQTQKIGKELPLYGNGVQGDNPPLPMFADTSLDDINRSKQQHIDFSVLKNALTRLKKLRHNISEY